MSHTEQMREWIETLKSAHDESLDDEGKSSRSIMRGVIDEMEAALTAPAAEVPDQLDELEASLESLVSLCNNDLVFSICPEVIAAEAALERLYRARTAPKAATAQPSIPEACQFDPQTAPEAFLQQEMAKLCAPAATAAEPEAMTGDEWRNVVASLGAALKRLSLASQTTGGTAGPDAELTAAIGQAEQAMSMSGVDAAIQSTHLRGGVAGWQWVPVKPTPEMIREVEHAARLGAVWTAESVYKAMLTAAPQAPAAALDAGVHWFSVAEHGMPDVGEEVIGGLWYTDPWLKPEVATRFTWGLCRVVKDNHRDFKDGKAWLTFGPAHNAITHWARLNKPAMSAQGGGK